MTTPEKMQDPNPTGVTPRTAAELDDAPEPKATDGGTPEVADESTYVDPEKIAEHLDAENAPRHAAERAEEDAQAAADNTVAPYELVPEQYKELADGYTADAQAIAKDANIPAQEMEVILHLAIGGALEAVSHDEHASLAVGQVPGVDLSNRNACMSYLTRKYGDQAPILVKEAVAAFKKLPPDVQAYLDHDGGTGELLTNSPHVLLALAARNLGWTGLTKESALKELDTLKQKGAKLSAFDLDKRRILAHIVSRGKKGDHQGLAKSMQAKAAPKVSPTGREKLLAEARTLRLDPAYARADHPNHKQVVNRMSAIYAELSPGMK